MCINNANWTVVQGFVSLLKAFLIASPGNAVEIIPKSVNLFDIKYLYVIVIS